jgi:hypothetical protein
MIVLCDNPYCGAVLRAAATYSPTQTVVQSEGNARYFDCPRCGVRTNMQGQPDAGGSTPQEPHRPST